MLEVLAAIDGALSEQHATTAELLIAARQMTVSALAQIRDDRSTSGRLLPSGRKNPKADIIRVAGDYCWELQKAILRRFAQTEPTAMGEA